MVALSTAIPAVALSTDSAITGAERAATAESAITTTEGAITGAGSGAITARESGAEGLGVASMGPMNASDPPPSKWSALRYGFRAKEDHDAEEET